MRRGSFLILAAGMATVGCGGSATDPDAGGGADAYVPIESHPLGMNDVTFLLPLPLDLHSPTLLGMTGPAGGPALVPRQLFDRLVTMPGDVVDPYEDFQVVAVRVDLCDRGQPGPCPTGVDGRLRLVIQPILPSGDANDVALHAFYPIAAAELPAVIDELRALARIQDTPVTAPLAVSPGFTAPSAAPDYADRLRTLVATYAREDRLVRLTLFAQNALTASLNWAFRGVERDPGGAFVDMMIPVIAATSQHVILVGSHTTYDTMPIADAPAGLALALDGDQFAAAATPARTGALAALAAVENPMTSAAQTVMCVGCHTSTFLTQDRASVAGIDPASIAGRFTSTYDLSTAAGTSTGNERALRALGWLFKEAAISQRVVNDTAEVLVEIDQQFPPRP